MFSKISLQVDRGGIPPADGSNPQSPNHPHSVIRSPRFSLWLSMMAKSFLVVFLGLYFYSATSAQGQHSDPDKQAEHMALHALLDPTDATHVAITGGDWTDASIWEANTVPGSEAKVHVPAGVVVNYDRNDTGRNAPISWIRVDGELRFETTSDTTLYVETLVSLANSTLQIGTDTEPVSAKCRIIITNDGPINTAWDWHQLSRGIVTHGAVRMHGVPKLTFSKLAQDVVAGATEVVLEDSVDDPGFSPWSVGDQLVITGTEFAQQSKFDPWITEDEERTVTDVSGDGRTITLDAPLTYDHTGHGDDILGRSMHGYVANFSRSIVIETENPDGLPSNERGHVMFMHNPDVDVRYVEFRELGRTDKSFPLDDFELEDNTTRFSSRVLDAFGDPIPYLRTNIRGRYALHFHRTGAEDLNGAAATAKGNAIWGSPGWGIVHHDSYLNLSDNVAYDIVGAHFVTETGNEIGTWNHNLAIKTPDGDGGAGKAGAPNHDVAFTGDGFWFQGRLIHVKNNVAAGVRGDGFKYFTRGVDQIVPRRAALDLPIITRYRDWIIEDRPQIQLFDDNTTFASGGGINVIKNNPAQGHDARSHIRRFTAWEVGVGVETEYTAKYTFTDMTLVYKNPSGGSRAIVLGNTIFDMVFERCRLVDFNQAFYWNGKDTTSQLSDYGLKFIDMELVNTPDDYEIVTGSTAGITNPDDHMEFLTAGDLTPGTLDILLDGNSNFDADQGDVVIAGTKIDSIGESPYLSEKEGDATFRSALLEVRARESGYWTDPEDPSLGYITVEELVEDRVNGERIIFEYPVTWSVVNIPNDAPYNGVWDFGGMEAILSYNFTGFNNDTTPVQQQQVDPSDTLGVEPVSGWVNFDLPSGDSDETFTDGNVSLIASNISGGGGAKSFQILPDTSDPNTDMLAAGWSIGGSTTLELTGLPSEAKDVYLYLGAAGGNGLRNNDIRLTGSSYGSTTYFAALSQGGGAGDGPTTNNSTTGYPGVGFVQVNSTDSGNRMDGNYILWQGVTDTSITITFPSDKFLGVTGIQIISE